MDTQFEPNICVGYYVMLTSEAVLFSSSSWSCLACGIAPGICPGCCPSGASGCGTCPAVFQLIIT